MHLFDYPLKKTKRKNEEALNTIEIINSGLRSSESELLPIQHTFHFIGNFIWGRKHIIGMFSSEPCVQ